MSGGAAVEGLPDLWDRVRAAPHRLLALDYDGTLAPFRVDRDAARPLPGTRPLLDRIAADPRTTVLVVSGRPAADVARLLDGPSFPIIGSHGFERRAPDGGVTRAALAPGVAERLAAAAAALAEEGARVERKPASVALHVRGLPAERASVLAERARRAWRPACADGALELRDFDGGVELRLTGCDKGSALRAFLRELPADTLALYVGDDETDEDAFRALPAGGLGIKVGGAGAATAARGRLGDPGAVLAFLRRWAEEIS